MKIIKKVLKSYGITPLFIEKVTNRFYRIDDGQKIYGLKQSRLTDETIHNWKYTYDQANSRQLTAILPVYLTNTSQLYTQEKGSYYYVSPWVPKDDFSLNTLLQTIGKIHATTREQHNINSRKFKKHWEKYESYTLTCFSTYMTFVEYFEKEHYMSPIGLQVCTHFRHIELVLQILQEQIKHFLNDVQNETQWNYCLCHGNLAYSHVRGHESVYILNWEKSQLDSASFDLSQFFQNEIKYADIETELFLNGFKHYMAENSLNDKELYLLTIYLLDPTKYLSIIDQYMQRKSATSMIKQIRELQHAYRQLLFGVELTKHIQENYLRPKVDDLDLES